jgi:hypothetical protein
MIGRGVQPGNKEGTDPLAGISTDRADNRHVEQLFAASLRLNDCAAWRCAAGMRRWSPSGRRWRLVDNNAISRNSRFPRRCRREATAATAPRRASGASCGRGMIDGKEKPIRKGMDSSRDAAALILPPWGHFLAACPAFAPGEVTSAIRRCRSISWISWEDMPLRAQPGTP